MNNKAEHINDADIRAWCQTKHNTAEQRQQIADDEIVNQSTIIIIRRFTEYALMLSHTCS